MKTNENAKNESISKVICTRTTQPQRNSNSIFGNNTNTLHFRESVRSFSFPAIIYTTDFSPFTRCVRLFMSLFNVEWPISMNLNENMNWSDCISRQTLQTNKRTKKNSTLTHISGFWFVLWKFSITFVTE